MALSDYINKRARTPFGATTTATTPDLSTAEGLADVAGTLGLEKEVNRILDRDDKKISFLQRLGKGLGAFNPAEAILTGGEKGFGAGVLKYGTGVLGGIGSAITGRDLEGDRRYFKDVAEKIGIENGIAKFGIGFLGDVFLDPSTYFGGALVKGLTKGVKGVTGIGLKGLGKVAPGADEGLRMASSALQDALGATFAAGYKTSKGFADDVMSLMGKQQRAKAGLAASNMNRLGTGVLTKGQGEELAMRMISGKRAEFTAREASSGLKIFHGTSAASAKAIKAGGIKPGTPAFTTKFGQRFGNKLGFSVTKDAKTAKKFGEEVLEFRISPSAKIAKGKDIPASFFKKHPDGDILFNQADVIKWAKDSGFDVIDLEDIEKTRAVFKTLKEPKLQELQVLNPKVILSSTPGKVGKETALEGATGVVRETIEQQSKRTAKFGAMVTENPYETYFPFLKQDKVNKFVYETRGLRVGSEGYRKQFKNLLTNEALEKNPAKAFFTRESQVVTDKLSRNFLEDSVKLYGKPLNYFKSVDEATSAGFGLIKEKGAFGKELGYLTKWDRKFVTEMLTPEFKSIDMIAKATGFDAVTSLFKRSVTGLFAPFHIRNYASGHIQNFETLGKAALNPQNIASGQKIAYNIAKGVKPTGSIKIAGKTRKLKEIFEPFYNRYANASFYMNDWDAAVKAGSNIEDYAKAFSKTSLKQTVKTVGLGQSGTHFKIARSIGNFIETSQKATAYVTALGQGKTIKESLKLAGIAGFDYRMLTGFESHIMKRLIPFYSFTRKNIELQLKTLGENPQRINQVMKFFENIGERPGEDERLGLPGYITEGLGIKLPDSADGLKQYIAQFGTPIENFAQLFGENKMLRVISMTNPILKAPIEIGIGKDSFRQKDLKDVYNAKEYSGAPQVLKDLLEIREVQKPVYDKVNGELVKTGERTEYIANPEKLLIARSLFTSRGVSYLDQVFGGDLKGFAKFAKLFTGLKPYQIDLEVSKYLKDKEQRRALEDLLIRSGALKEFRNVYQPKQ